MIKLILQSTRKQYVAPSTDC